MNAENELVTRSRSSISAMIELLRDRRGILYVGTPSIECLAAYIGGWFWALSEHCDDMEVWNNFLDFVVEKYNDTEHRSWKALILFHSANSYEAYQNFFRDFDQSVERLKAIDRP